MNNYHIKYSTIERDSGLLQQSSSRDNRKKVISALNELKNKNVIQNYQKEESKRNKKIYDVLYTMTPTMSFVGDQKAANKRYKNSTDSLINCGKESVDNLLQG